ncbi:hypothetical protein DRN79_03115 [Methanosarcinales archaeon]|nr:MAG: hypothetical protein DRN79_03115 [Methanosarcinales archaeon]
MRIDEYNFGRIVVDGKEYTEDLIILTDKIKANWWRKEGHLLLKEDIEDVIEEEKPEILIVGTGKYGYMKIADETREYAAEKGVEIIAERTDEACRIFNELSSMKRVVAALHLTC